MNFTAKYIPSLSQVILCGAKGKNLIAYLFNLKTNAFTSQTIAPASGFPCVRISINGTVYFRDDAGHVFSSTISATSASAPIQLKVSDSTYIFDIVDNTDGTVAIFTYSKAGINYYSKQGNDVFPISELPSNGAESIQAVNAGNGEYQVYVQSSGRLNLFKFLNNKCVSHPVSQGNIFFSS